MEASQRSKRDSPTDIGAYGRDSGQAWPRQSQDVVQESGQRKGGFLELEAASLHLSLGPMSERFLTEFRLAGEEVTARD
jgi:hypothetical protein